MREAPNPLAPRSAALHRYIAEMGGCPQFRPAIPVMHPGGRDLVGLHNKRSDNTKYDIGIPLVTFTRLVLPSASALTGLIWEAQWHLPTARDTDPWWDPPYGVCGGCLSLTVMKLKGPHLRPVFWAFYRMDMLNVDGNNAKRINNSAYG